MLNNIILAILFIFFVITLSYIHIRLKEEALLEQQTENKILTPEDMVREVESFIVNGDHVTAQKLAKKFLEQEPNNHELRKLLIGSYIETQKEYDAISHLTYLTQFYPDDLVIFSTLACLYRLTHQHKKAIHYFSYVLSKDKYNLNAMRNLAELYFKNKQKDSALKLLKQLITYIDDEEEKLGYFEMMANIYTTYGNYQKAIDLYKKILEKNPGNINIIKELRQIYIQIKDIDNVIDSSKKLIRLEPQNSNHYEEIIHLLFNLQEYDEALLYAQKALEIQGTDKCGIKNLIAKIYIYTGQISKSINLITEAIMEDPANIELCNTLAMAYCMGKNFEQAKMVCKNALEYAPSSEIKNIYNNLSTILAEEAVHLLNTGKNKEAFDKFSEAMKYNNENPEIFFKLSQANRAIKNYSESIRQCKRAIELSPENSLYYETLGDIYYETQNFIEAKKHYKESICINPKNARAHAFLGILQSKDKEHNLAIKSLETAVSLDKTNIDIRYNLALAYEVAGRKEEAIAEYKKVLELNPKHKEASNNLQLLQ